MARTLTGRADRSPTVLYSRWPRSFHKGDPHFSGRAARVPSDAALRTRGIQIRTRTIAPRGPGVLIGKTRPDEDYYVDALTFCSTTTAVGTRPSASSVAPSSR